MDRGGSSLLRIYNTLTKKVEEIQPLEPNRVRMYTCGPTVYRDAHIGNLRTYMMADWIRRVIEDQGYEVYQVKNITDVGHMRQELVEAGGDKIIMAALAEGKTTQDIADHYTEVFHRDEARGKHKTGPGVPGGHPAYPRDVGDRLQADGPGIRLRAGRERLL